MPVVLLGSQEEKGETDDYTMRPWGTGEKLVLTDTAPKTGFAQTLCEGLIISPC